MIRDDDNARKNVGCLQLGPTSNFYTTFCPIHQSNVSVLLYKCLTRSESAAFYRPVKTMLATKLKTKVIIHLLKVCKCKRKGIHFL